MVAASTQSHHAEPAPLVSRGGPVFWRPFKYVHAFMLGTGQGILDTMAHGGRTGAKLGVLAAVCGLLSGVSTVGIPLLAVGWMVGLVNGAMLGAAVGAITGGIQGVKAARHGDVLDDKKAAKTTARSHSNAAYRADFRREYKHANTKQYHRMFLDLNENKGDSEKYFQNKVLESRGHHHEQGLW